MGSDNKELRAWRDSHFEELESTLQVLKAIRDDPEASNKDRIEASKSLGRLLAAMAPEKVSQEKSEEKDAGDVVMKGVPTLPPHLRRKLRKVLSAPSRT